MLLLDRFCVWTRIHLLLFRISVTCHPHSCLRNARRNSFYAPSRLFVTATLYICASRKSQWWLRNELLHWSTIPLTHPSIHRTLHPSFKKTHIWGRSNIWRRSNFRARSHIWGRLGAEPFSGAQSFLRAESYVEDGGSGGGGFSFNIEREISGTYLLTSYEPVDAGA